jgi:hypothetical protein
LAEQDLPDLMQELNIKDFTLSNGSKVQVDDFISATVPSAGAIDRAKGDDRVNMEIRQQHCFDWLRSNGAGDLIKNNVEVQFGRNEDDACDEFAIELSSRAINYKRSVGVHPRRSTPSSRSGCLKARKFPMTCSKSTRVAEPKSGDKNVKSSCKETRVRRIS